LKKPHACELTTRVGLFRAAAKFRARISYFASAFFSTVFA
jgi:hypothetical protein